MPAKRVLLGIFAHPDDESFGPGATLARYADQGVDVHVVIATDGIAGSVDEETQVTEHYTLAQVRSSELSRAAVALGVTSVWSLPYRDSGMRGTPDNQHPSALIRQPLIHTIEEVLGYIERLRPQVIMTHDPYGGYGHPDHVRCCEATTAAFYLARAAATTAGDPGWIGPQKLYFTAFPKWLIKFFVRLMPLVRKDPTAFGRNKDINLVEISEWETPVHTRVYVGSYQQAKWEASRAHASQFSGGPAWTRAVPAPIRRRVLDYELYTRAFPAPGGRTETDLFDGVRA
jgi:LmbE family N-acetylglucosaminyl deacetylase